MGAVQPPRARVRVTGATPEDIPAMLPIWLAMMRAHQARDRAFTLVADAEGRWRAWVAGLMAQAHAFVLAARLADGTLAGFTIGWLADNLPIYAERELGFVSELATAPGLRRRGVGSALLAGCRAWFARRDVHEFQLATAVWNAEARAFWRAAGGAPLLVRYRFLTDSSGRLSTIQVPRGGLGLRPRSE